MKDLETCRKEIDEIDQQMIALFEKRMNIAIVFFIISRRNDRSDLPLTHNKFKLIWLK